MVQTLSPHPNTPSTSVERIEVDFQHEGRSSTLVQFRLKGACDRIVIPAVSAGVEEAQRSHQLAFMHATIASRSGRPSYPGLPGSPGAGRADGLWRTTCFEVFAGLSDGSYAEFNLSPSKEWAAYGFDGYRKGMRDLAGSVEVFKVERLGDGLEVCAWLNWTNWPGSRRIGLSAVIEGTDGNISYWALAHPSDKPDFHHPDSFALILPPSETA
jgi:hypothetical protein